MTMHVSLKLALWSIPLSLVFFLSRVSDSFNLTKLMLLLVFATASSIIFILNWQLIYIDRTNRGGFPKEVFLYLSFALAVAVAGFLSTPNLTRYLWGAPSRANGILYYVSVTVLSIIVIMLIRQENLLYLAKLLRLGFLILALYSLIQYLGLDPIQWSNPYNPIIGTLGNPNFSAAALAIASIFFLSTSALGGDNVRKIRVNASSVANVVLGLLCAFLSWKTDSLQGPLIFLSGLSLIVVVLFFRNIKKIKTRIAISLIGIIAGFALLLSMAGLGPLGAQLEQYTLKLRGIYAGIGFQAMLDSPFTGYGVDSYLIAFRKFRTEDFVASYGTGTLTNNAHSVPFQIGATFGLVVLTLYLLIHALILFRSIKIIVSNSRFGDSRIRVIAIVWLLLFAQSLLSIEQIGLGAMTWILGAVILSCGSEFDSVDNDINLSRKKLQKTVRESGFAEALTYLLLVLFTLPMWFLIRQDAAWKNIVALEITNGSEREFVENQLSVMNSFVLSEPEKLGPVLAKLQSVGLQDRIGPLIEDSLRVNPQDAYANELKSQWYRTRQEFDSELAQLLVIKNLDPLNSSIWLRIGEVQILLGDTESAKNSLSRAIEISGNLEVMTKAQGILATLD